MLADTDYTLAWLNQQQQRHDDIQQQQEQSVKQQQQQRQKVAQMQQEAAADSATTMKMTEADNAQFIRSQAAGAGDNSVLFGTGMTSAGKQAGEGNTSAGGTGDTASGISRSQPKWLHHHHQQQLNDHHNHQQQQQQQQDQLVAPPGCDRQRPVPLLLLMAHPGGPFLKALTIFQTRLCAANIRYDATVGGAVNPSAGPSWWICSRSTAAETGPPPAVPVRVTVGLHNYHCCLVLMRRAGL
jgi:hypothetical protein